MNLKKLYIVVLAIIAPVLSFAQGNIVKEVDSYVAKGAYEKAQDILLKAIKVNPSLELRDKLGVVYSYQLKWDNAIEIYQELTKEAPKSVKYQFRYSGALAKKAQSSGKFKAFMLLGRIKDGFRKTITLDANHIGAHWALIDLYVTLPGIAGGSKAKAYQYAEKLKKISPLDGYLALGYIYEYDDEPEKSEKSYLKALSYLEEGDFDRNQLHYQIGKVCAEYAMKLDKGIFHMQEYIANYSVMDGVPLEWAYYRLAKLYRKKKDKEQALVWVNKALINKPNFKPALKEQEIIRAL